MYSVEEKREERRQKKQEIGKNKHERKKETCEKE